MVNSALAHVRVFHGRVTLNMRMGCGQPAPYILGIICRSSPASKPTASGSRLAFPAPAGAGGAHARLTSALPRERRQAAWHMHAHASARGARVRHVPASVAVTNAAKRGHGKRACGGTHALEMPYLRHPPLPGDDR